MLLGRKLPTLSDCEYSTQMNWILCVCVCVCIHCCCSVSKSYLTLCDPWTATHQASLSITDPRVCSNSCPLSQWCHPTVSCSVIPFSSHLQCFPASGSFPMSQFFASGSQSIGVSASASVFPMNIPDWFPLGLTGWISLQSRGLSRVFSNTTVQKHQFFGAQLSYRPTLTSSFCPQ